jgi:hypothetical protein
MKNFRETRTLPLILALLINITWPCLAMAAPEGIGWIPTLEQALAEASKTHKPILMVAGCAQFGHVPGVW